jgi:2-desacetyl-2-hydroxyethyl bacteriochlorophyllide A dehydrogenase
MQAAVLESPRSMMLVERADPADPGPGEVLVAVRRVGICGTDHHAYNGMQNFLVYPRVLGHELAVEVLEVGAGVTHLRPGDLCAVLPYVSCGTCRACQWGRTNCCERIKVLGVTEDGGLCERMVIPAALLFADPDLTLDQLVLVETLGIGWHAVARARPQPEDRVLVLGAGPIGLAVAQAARHRVEHLLIADISAERVGCAAASGLDTLLVDGDVAAQVLDRSDGGLPSVVFDATGSRQSMEAAFGLTGSCGTLVFVGHTTESLRFENPSFHARELDLRASRNATVSDWSEVITSAREGTLDALGWINHRTTLAGIVDELPRLAADPGRVVKTVVELGHDTARSPA